MANLSIFFSFLGPLGYLLFFGTSGVPLMPDAFDCAFDWAGDLWGIMGRVTSGVS